MRRPTAEVTTSAVRDGDSWVLSGHKNPVLAGDCADTLVVSAALPDGGTGLFLVNAAAVHRQPYRTFDGQRGAQIDFDNVAAEPLGEAVDGELGRQPSVTRSCGSRRPCALKQSARWRRRCA